MIDRVLAERSLNQKLVASDLRKPEDVVSWFGAMQAQDFQGGTWAIGLRARKLTAAAVERAYNDGRILRTHVLRPTWHFVHADDIRWLLALTGPRILARSAGRHRQLELDAHTLRRSRAVLSRALRDDALTRREIAGALQRGGVHLTPERLLHVLMIAEVEGLICSGPLRDRKITYALMDARAPSGAPVDAGEALARLAVRYFGSHGPATLADFAWWAGLTLSDARSAVEMAGRALSRDALAGTTCVSARRQRAARLPAGSTWLLPNYDEYTVAYRDRAAVLGDRGIDPREVLNPTVVIDGRAAATWYPARKASSVSIAVVPRRKLSRGDVDRIDEAASRYSAFLEMPVTVRHGAKAP